MSDFIGIYLEIGNCFFIIGNSNCFGPGPNLPNGSNKSRRVLFLFYFFSKLLGLDVKCKIGFFTEMLNVELTFLDFLGENYFDTRY